MSWGFKEHSPPHYYEEIYCVTEAITSRNLVQKIDEILNTLMCAQIWLVHENTDLSIIDLTVEKKAWTWGFRHDMWAHQSHAHSKLLTGAGNHTKKEHRAQQIHPKCRHPPPQSCWIWKWTTRTILISLGPKQNQILSSFHHGNLQWRWWPQLQQRKGLHAQVYKLTHRSYIVLSCSNYNQKWPTFLHPQKDAPLNTSPHENTTLQLKKPQELQALLITVILIALHTTKTFHALQIHGWLLCTLLQDVNPVRSDM